MCRWGTVDQPHEPMPLVIFAKPAGKWVLRHNSAAYFIRDKEYESAVRFGGSKHRSCLQLDVIFSMQHQIGQPECQAIDNHRIKPARCAIEYIGKIDRLLESFKISAPVAAMFGDPDAHFVIVSFGGGNEREPCTRIPRQP